MILQRITLGKVYRLERRCFLVELFVFSIMNGYLCKKTMKSILDLSETKAYKFFMESSNYCSLDLPQYITFDKILRYVESAVGNKTLEDIL